MSIQKKIKKSLNEGNTITIAGIPLYKMTASSFTLCEELGLAIITGKESSIPQSEMLCFIYLHFVGPREARELIYDDSEGYNSSGKSKAFLNACMDWADDLPMDSYTKLTQGVNTLLTEAFQGAVETVAGDEGGKAKKVA